MLNDAVCECGSDIEKEGCMEWRFAYEPGVLKAVCGEAFCVLETAGAAADLTAKRWMPDGETEREQEILQIEVTLLDENGRPAANDLEVWAEVTGGILLGMENGDLADLTPYNENHRKTKDARLILYVKPKDDAEVWIKCPALGKKVSI